jgi:hypothetical protein
MLCDLRGQNLLLVIEKSFVEEDSFNERSASLDLCPIWKCNKFNPFEDHCCADDDYLFTTDTALRTATFKFVCSPINRDRKLGPQMEGAETHWISECQLDFWEQIVALSSDIHELRTREHSALLIIDSLLRGVLESVNKMCCIPTPLSQLVVAFAQPQYLYPSLDQGTFSMKAQMVRSSPTELNRTISFLKRSVTMSLSLSLTQLIVLNHTETKSTR